MYEFVSIQSFGGGGPWVHSHILVTPMDVAQVTEFEWRPLCVRHVRRSYLIFLLHEDENFPNRIF